MEQPFSPEFPSGPHFRKTIKDTKTLPQLSVGKVVEVINHGLFHFPAIMAIKGSVYPPGVMQTVITRAQVRSIGVSSYISLTYVVSFFGRESTMIRLSFLNG